MKALLALLTVTASLTSTLALATPNFECDVFSSSGTTGKFSMSGEDPETQKYALTISDGRGTPKKLKGSLHLKGMLPFNQLDLETQRELINAMKSSRRAHLKIGSLVVYGNTTGTEESTMNVYLMPSGEIAYLQVGFLEAFCM